jgi:hypothetical protein
VLLYTSSAPIITKEIPNERNNAASVENKDTASVRNTKTVVDRKNLGPKYGSLPLYLFLQDHTGFHQVSLRLLNTLLSKSSFKTIKIAELIAANEINKLPSNNILF